MDARATSQLSVVIATKNAGRTLGNCLASIKSQSQPVLETIVVDNFSRDDSVEIAKRYGATVHQRGHERSEQRNYGLRHAQGEYVLMIDADMCLAGQAVAHCLQALAENDAVVLSEASFGAGFWAHCKWLERRCYEGEAAIEAARGFRRDALLRLGGYDEELFAFEDWDLHNRTLAAGFRIGRASSDVPLIAHDEGRLSLRRTVSKKSYYGGALKRYAEKHPQAARYQVGLLPRLQLFLRHRTLLARYPLLTTGVIVMKAAEALAGRVGAVATTTPRHARRNWRLRDG